MRKPEIQEPLDGTFSSWITEKAWQSQVIQLARWHKWKAVHFRPARVVCEYCHRQGCNRCKGSGYVFRTAVEGDGKGFPDTILARPPRLIIAELKKDTAKLIDPDQIQWLAWLSQCPGVETYIWRPKDYDEVERLLK